MSDERVITLRGLEIGDGTYYPFAEDWVDGLGVPQMRTADQPRGALAGQVGGDDVVDKRVLRISIGLQGNERAADLADGTTNQQSAMELLDALKTAWAPSQVDVDLLVEMGTYWARTFRGRPRGVDEDMKRSCDGIIRCLCTFEALNPYATGEAVDFTGP